MNNIRDITYCGNLVRELLEKMGPGWLGFWAQGVAAHIMLRLGIVNLTINTTGHPDIEGYLNGNIIRAEIECDSTGRGLHNLTVPDFKGLAPRTPLDEAFYGLLKATIRPEWIIIPYNKIINIKESTQIPILESIADDAISRLWTELFVGILIDKGNIVKTLDYKELCRLALNEEGL
ncbi:hypothetical protein ACFLQJ_02350 [Calditrichota bacterium]